MKMRTDDASTRRVAVDLEDPVSLADFVELWWAEEAPGEDDGDFAGFLDRKQAALRMLRRNHAGFPEPISSAGRSRLYRLGDLVDWVVEAVSVEDPEAAVVQRVGAVAPAWHLWRAVEAGERELGALSCRNLVVALVTALGAARRRSKAKKMPAAVERMVATDRLPTLLGVEAEGFEEGCPALRGVFSRLLEGLPQQVTSGSRLLGAIWLAVQSGTAAAEVADQILARLDGGNGERKPTLTGDSLVQLLLAAGDPVRGEVVLDPAAGEGNLLLAVGRRLEGSVHLIGYESDPDAWAIAKCRLWLHGIEADLHLGPSLDGVQPLPCADLVLVDPPLQSRRDYHRWLALAEECRRPGGRAVIALPVISAGPRRREWAEVGQHRAGALIKCPARLRSDHGDALVLWVLEHDDSEPVLLVDASSLGHQRGTSTEVNTEEAAALDQSLRSWRGRREVTGGGPIVVSVRSREDIGARGVDFSARGPSAAALSPGVDNALRNALALAEELSALVEGPLRNFTAEEHRRALRRLLRRLSGEVRGDALPG